MNPITVSPRQTAAIYVGRLAVTALMALLVAAALVLIAGAAGPGVASAKPKPPAAGNWNVKKGSTTGLVAKKGSAKVTNKGKKLAKLKIVPRRTATESCGSTKPIVLKKKLPIKYIDNEWRIGKRSGDGYIGLAAKFKQGGKKVKGFVNFSFYKRNKGSGSVRIDGCSITFVLKKK